MSVCYSNCNCCQLVTELRADLATVTAERDQIRAQLISFDGGPLVRKADLDTERAAHAETRDELEKFQDCLQSTRAELAETRKALEEEKAANANAEQVSDELKSMRAALARSEARVRELEASYGELDRG